jgi:Bacteriophage tail sheath protein
MAVQVSVPGVYIEEFAPGAPIQGVGTNNAGFIGIAPKGVLRVPTKLTSWDQFREQFGELPVVGFFLWYAVRGFFENGGQVCYVVRASNGDYMSLELDDGAGSPVLRVRARQPGQVPATPQIDLTVTRTFLLPAPPNTTAVLYRPTSTYNVTDLRELTLPSIAAAAQFRPADWVHLGAANPRVQIARIAGNTVRLAVNFIGAINDNGTIRLADTQNNTRTVRIRPAPPLPAGTLVPGAMLSIQQGNIIATQIVETVQTEPLATAQPDTTYRVTFRDALGFGFSLDPAGADPVVWSHEFSMLVGQGAASTLYAGLSMDPAHPRYVITALANDPLVVVELIEPPPATALIESLPDDAAQQALQGGANEDLATIQDQHFIDALDTLRLIDDVNLIAVPDCLRLTQQQGSTLAVQDAVRVHCEQMGDRFGVLDSLPGVPLFGADSLETQRAGLDSVRGYVALYAPWVRVRPAAPGPPVLVPPSGHVCGLIARTDSTRGVHKAPANETLNGTLGVETVISDVEQGQLNLQGINIIRVFQTGARPMVWGARTTATGVDNNWMYVNVRRLFLFVEESIQEGSRWAVFEPNDTGLWQRLKRSITDFLTRVWRDGALFGDKAEDAFYVRIDEALNPESERKLGRLTIEIGLRPSYPTEFIIVRIGISPAESTVTEV